MVVRSSGRAVITDTSMNFDSPAMGMPATAGSGAIMQRCANDAKECFMVCLRRRQEPTPIVLLRSRRFRPLGGHRLAGNWVWLPSQPFHDKRPASQRSFDPQPKEG